MTQQELFIKMALQAWEIQLKRMNAAFDGLSDEDLFLEIAPGKNRAIYLLGHMTAVHDMMLPLLGLGSRQHKELDEAFISNADKVVKDLPDAVTLRRYWVQVNEVLAQQFARLSADEWFQKHTAVSVEDFAKEPYRNKLNVLISRTNHVAYHHGQLVLLKK